MKITGRLAGIGLWFKENCGGEKSIKVTSSLPEDKFAGLCSGEWPSVNPVSGQISVEEIEKATSLWRTGKNKNIIL
jgi:hypothetical protein